MNRTATRLSALIFALLASLAVRAQDANTVTLTLLHTNDLHGHLLPFAYTEVGKSPAEKPSVGGAARRATLIRRIRQSAKNPVLLVDSGDLFTRGPFTTTYLGLADVEASNAVGYDLAALGNNEFKARDAAEAGDAAGAQAALLDVIKHSRFPWLCANCTDQKGALLEGVQPYVVRQIGPIRVGFLGLTAPRVATYPQAKGWTVIDAVTAAKKYIPIARAHCDILIAVTHIGVDLDKQLAAQTTGLDAIVGGDSHTFLYQPLEVRNADGSATVPIVQDGEFGVNLGRFDLTFERAANGAWHVARYHEELLPVGPDLREAAEVAAAVEPFARPLMQVVGTLPADRIGKTPEERDRLTTQVIMDALRRQTRADYAVSPAGDGLFEVFRTRSVRLYDIYAVMPFKDHAVIARLTGAQLQALIAGNKANVVSGDAAQIDAAATYRVALIDYLAGADYKLKRADLQDTGKNVYDLVITDLGGAK